MAEASCLRQRQAAPGLGPASPAEAHRLEEVLATLGTVRDLAGPPEGRALALPAAPGDAGPARSAPGAPPPRQSAWTAGSGAFSDRSGSLVHGLRLRWSRMLEWPRPPA